MGSAEAGIRKCKQCGATFYPKSWLCNDTKNKRIRISKTEFCSIKCSHRDPDTKRKHAGNAILAWNNRRRRDLMVAGIRKACKRQDVIDKKNVNYSNPGWIKKRSDTSKASLSDPAVKNKLKIAAERTNRDPEVRRKMYSTKKRNGTFNVSKPEIELTGLAKSIWGDKVQPQYSDSRYHGVADLYINDGVKEVFVEFHLHWVHGGEPYVSNNLDHQKKLTVWEEKAKTSKFYLQAIRKWTISDVAKVNAAKKNNIKLIVFYNKDDAKQWLKKQETANGDR